MSQLALAERVGVTRGVVANWESEAPGAPSMKNLMRLALATGVALEWLATGQGGMLSGERANALIASPLPAINDTMELDLLKLFRTAGTNGKSALLQMARLLQGQP